MISVHWRRTGDGGLVLLDAVIALVLIGIAVLLVSGLFATARDTSDRLANSLANDLVERETLINEIELRHGAWR